MPRLRCTHKLLQAIGSRGVLPMEPMPPTLLGDWYANLLFIARQRTLLFTNAATLYSFAVLGVRQAAFAHLPRLFLEQLQRTLAAERIPPAMIGRVLAEYRDLTLAGTASRSILGSMNDLAALLAWIVREAGGPTHCDLAALHRQLNATPHKPLGWKTAAEALRSRLLGVVSLPGPQQDRVFLN